MIRDARIVLTILTGLNLLNYLDRLVLSAVLGSLQDDLHLSNATGGALGLVFLVGYFAASPMFGAWADRSSHATRLRLIALGIALWSVATVATGLAHGTAALFAARAFVGVGEASYATIAPTLIDDLAPASHKARWMAIFYAAIPVGSALGYIVGGQVLHATGSWRAAFFVAGGPGIALATLCLLFSEPARAAAPPARRGTLGTLRSLARVPTYRATVLGYCLYTFAIGGLGYWAPTYLHRRYGLDQGRASVWFGMVTVVGGAVGTLIGGWVADRLARRAAARAEHGPEGPDAALARAHLSICALSAGVGAPLAAAALMAPTAGGFVSTVLPCEIALFLLSGPVNLAVLRSAPRELRASAMAISIFAIHALGDLWSPLLIGVFADHAPMRSAMFVAPLGFAGAALLWWRGRTPVASARLT